MSGPRAALLLCAAVLCAAPPAAARYPRVARDAQGTWVATDGALLRVTDDLFTFYTSADGLPSDRVRMVTPDDREVWVATPRGLARMDRNAQRWEVLRAPDPLPSDDVRAVSVDDRSAWVATGAGAVRWDKVTKRWEAVDAPQGPGRGPVEDVLSLGQTVWFACGQELRVLDRGSQAWRRYGAAEGLAVGPLEELLQLGESLWVLGRDGLARLDLRAGSLSVFGPAQGLPAGRLTAFAQVQGEVWLAVGGRLVVYNPGSDALSPFMYAEGMPAGGVVGIEVSAPWVWVVTEHGVGLFNLLQRTWEQKREEDGLRPATFGGTALAGSMLVLLSADGYQGYQLQRDDWQAFSLEALQGGAGAGADPAGGARFHVEATLSVDSNVVRSSGAWSHDEQVLPDVRLGFGTPLEGGRSLDASLRVDLGDAMQSGVREYDAELRYRGSSEDLVRELILSDELRLHAEEGQHDLLDEIWLEGLGIYQRLGPARGRAPVSAELEAGLNRGVRAREFFRGTIDYTLQLEHPYVTPRSERVKVDGMLLERDVDYIVTHTTGQVTFLNPDRVNALSLVEVTYTYEQIPRKGSTAITLLELLPRDDELGAMKRSGSPAYVTDEGGMYAQIDGAAPKYLERGWVESVFQDYAQGSTKVSVQIHDMGSPENAASIFDYDRPLSYVVLWDEPDTIALLDQGLPAGYAVKMRLERYYVELSIDDKTKASEILIGLFAATIRAKGDLAGIQRDALRELVGRLHLGVSPHDAFGLGVGFLGAGDLEEPGLEALEPQRLELVSFDGWTRHGLGGGDWGGELASFFQLAQGRTTWAGGGQRSLGASGDVTYTSPALNVRLDGEYQSPDFDALGSRETALGTFQSELRGELALSPWRGLNLQLTYDRETSVLRPGLGAEGGQGLVENLVGRLSFVRDRWPTVWLLGARSVLSGGGHEDEKWRVAGSFEYDLAHGLLEVLGLKKLVVKAYYDRSENEVLEGPEPIDPRAAELWRALASTPGTADNLRAELKFAPTSTEDAYARFERKTFSPASSGGPVPPLEAWELLGGAASRWLPGLVPTFNTKIGYQKGLRPSASGPGQAFETAQSNLSGGLDVFPGRWLDALASLQLSLGYGYTMAEEAEEDEGGLPGRLGMKVDQAKHQVEAKLAYGRYDEAWRFEGRTKWWTVSEQVSPDETLETERTLEVVSRLTYRPVYTSPITARLDATRAELWNPDLLRMGETLRFVPALEWERRWSRDLVSRLRFEAPIRLVDGAWDELVERSLTFSDVGLTPWAELRWRATELWEGSLVRLSFRGAHTWVLPYERGAGGSGAERSRELLLAGYLDWERPGAFLLRLGVLYVWHVCQELDLADTGAADEECRALTRHAIQPSLKLLARF
ncbi:MAG TPA: hypothetical protein PK668_12340 [Myxococcota bacterium]|nr:hypothetical protein [Myxococcota bacterium]HRY93742.1 hypothetical protein [Myxococcota bacterium]